MVGKKKGSQKGVQEFLPRKEGVGRGELQKRARKESRGGGVAKGNVAEKLRYKRTQPAKKGGGGMFKWVVK